MPDFPEDQKIVINDRREPIVVAPSEFKSEARIDVRHHYHDGDGELQPTKKGVSLTPDEARQIGEHLIALADIYG